jgi:hypothetical protein
VEPQKTPIVLEAAGVKTYADLYELPVADVLKRLNERSVPLHPGDAFLAVLVLRAVAELETSAKRLNAAGTRFQIAGLVLAAVAVAVAIAQLAN